MATIFVGGLVAIRALARWAQQVTEALVLLLAAVALMAVVACLDNRWPDYFAAQQMPVATPALPAAD